VEPQTYSIGILEDDEFFRDQLVRIVEADFGLTLAFACGTLAEALAAYRSALPDLVLVDMQLPDGPGVDLIHLATASGKASLMLTMLADRATVLGAFEAGAQAYLLKDMEPAQIHSSIIATLAGQSPISPAVAIHLLQLVRAAPPAAGSSERLTEREMTILNMIARGLTYAETARAASISVHTVGDHIKAIYRKLEVNSKSEAIYEARQMGLLKRYD
jgi:DNA-binding NarL/FixJ family response regulator